MEIVLQDVA